MISKTEYKILKTLKKEPKPRDSFEYTKTVDSLIDNDYIEITYGKKVKDPNESLLGRNCKFVELATFEQLLKLTSKGINAISEFRKHVLKVFLKIPLWVIGTIFVAVVSIAVEYYFPKIISTIETIFGG